LDAYLGAGTYTVDVRATPDGLIVIVTVKCYDGHGSATEVANQLSTDIGKAFSRDGQTSDATVSNTVVDPGTTSTSGESNSASTLIVSACGLMLMIVALLL